MVRYDPDKSEWTWHHRGFDFAYAARIFDGATLEWSSPRAGEERILAVGQVDDIILTVVYKWEAGERRIISARPARRSERHVYRAQNFGPDPS